MNDDVNESAPLTRLRGVLKMIASQCPDKVQVFDYNLSILETTQTYLQTRRKRGRTSSQQAQSQMVPFLDLVTRHRYVCFFFVQGSGMLHSQHSLALRKRLASNYHDSMTTFIVCVHDDCGERLFSQGTGFGCLPSSAVLMTLLNVSQVPTTVIIDTTTGRPISLDAGLAIEWNDPHSVINAWQRGSSGLSCSQKALAVMTCQSNCVIL